MVDNNSLEVVRNKILELGKIINAPEDLVFMPTKTDHFATPHIEIRGNKFHYIAIEKGYECLHKQTDDMNLLLYWFFEGVTSQMATTFELNHRNPSQDFRRILFAKWIELIGLINPIWGKWLKKKLDEVLERSPFIDP